MSRSTPRIPDWQEVLNFLATHPLSLASYLPLSDRLLPENQKVETDLDTDVLPLARPQPLFASDNTTFLQRAFVFVDLCGYTSFTKKQGPETAARVLSVFRAILRDVAARRDVRVAKWLGDGAMLVSVNPAYATALAAEMVAHLEGSELRLRAGVAYGPVLLFEGDDHLGEAVNLASRLCDLASPGEVLCDPESAKHLPEWVEIRRHQRRHIPGLGVARQVISVGVSEGVLLPDPV